MRISEIGYSVAYDSLNNILLAGTQDNGAIEQREPNSKSWRDIDGGDGNHVAVDNSGVNAIRYTMGNNFRSFTRREFDGQNDDVSPVEQAISNVITAADGAGLVQIVSAGHGLKTGDKVVIDGVVGVPAANNLDDFDEDGDGDNDEMFDTAKTIGQVTVVDGNNFVLNGSTFSGGYISGGTFRSVHKVGAISGDSDTDVTITWTSHGLTTGDKVLLNGTELADGDKPAVNGSVFSVTVITGDKFSLDDSSGEGPYAQSKGFWRKTNRLLLTGASGGDYLTGLTGSDRNFDNFSSIPYVINAVDPTRLLIGLNGLYESNHSSRGDVVDEIEARSVIKDPTTGRQRPTVVLAGTVSALAYGGKERTTQDGVEVIQDNPEVIYVASGKRISVRSEAGADFVSFDPGGADVIFDLVLDPENWRTAFAIDETHVWMTVNGGEEWKEISGTLAATQSKLGAVEIVRNKATGSLQLLAGTGNGVYRAAIEDAQGVYDGTVALKWTVFGTGLANARVTDLLYNVADDVLIAGTLGRGVWMIFGTYSQLFETITINISGTAAADTVQLKRSATTPSLLETYVNGTLIPELLT